MRARVPLPDALVVDADERERARVCELLERARFSVRACGTVAEACAAWMVRVPDLVVVELSIEGSAGAALAARARATPGLEHVALIAVSDRVDPHWEIVRHFDAYVRKPLGAGLFQRLAVQLVDSTRAARPRGRTTSPRATR